MTTEVEKIIEKANTSADLTADKYTYAHLATVEAILETELRKAYREIDRLHQLNIDLINQKHGDIRPKQTKEG